MVRAQQREAEMNRQIQQSSTAAMHERMVAQELSQKLDAAKGREAKLSEDLELQIQTFNSVQESSEGKEEEMKWPPARVPYDQAGFVSFDCICCDKFWYCMGAHTETK